MVEHRNATDFVTWAKSEFSEDVLSRTLFSTSINFDLAVYELFAPLSVGAAVILVQNALALVHESADITLVKNIVPSTMNILVGTSGIPEMVRIVNLAGEALKRELVDRIFDMTEVGMRSAISMGPSETTTYSHMGGHEA